MHSGGQNSVVITAEMNHGGGSWAGETFLRQVSDVKPRLSFA